MGATRVLQRANSPGQFRDARLVFRPTACRGERVRIASRASREDP
jgi:hypothetical protein